MVISLKKVRMAPGKSVKASEFLFPKTKMTFKNLM